MLRLLCACLVALPAAAVAAAGAWERDATPVFRHVGVPSELMPTTMLQDGQGLIWMASQTGLTSWDGYRFHRYTADPTRPGSLPSAYIYALHEDRKGRLWVATNSGGLARLDKATGRFWTPAPGKDSAGSTRVFALADDGADGLWMGTADGLRRLDDATGQVLPSGLPGATPRGLPPRRVGALLRDRLGNLWIGTVDGLYEWRGGRQTVDPMPLADAQAAGVDVQHLMEDDAGRIWVGTRTRGVFVIEPGAAPRRVADDTRPGETLAHTDLRAIVDIGDGRVLLGTWGQGILQVDTRSWTTRRLRHDPELPASLSSDYVTSMLRDRSGLVWVGGPNMLDSHDPGQQTVTTWYGRGDRLLGGTRAEVTAMLAASDGSVWLGSGNGGVDIVPPDRGRGRHLLPDESRPRTALPKSVVTTLLQAPDGRVLVGTGKGLYRVSGGVSGNERVERLDAAGPSPDAVIRALCIANGHLWVGGMDGLRAVDLSDGGAAAPGPPVLRGEEISTLDCQDGGPFWVGTQTGLARYWPDSGRVERPWAEGPGRAGLPNSPVSAVAKDGRGRLWVAFYGGGVYVMEADSAAASATVPMHHVGHAQGLQNDAANALLLDAQGNAWVSTDNGLLRIDRDTFATTLLQQADGVGLLGYWTSSATTTPEGELLFGSDGLTIVHPGEFHPDRYKAPIVLTGADGLPVPASGIALAPPTRAVQVDFALLDYSAPERAHYAYRLAGLEDAWTDSPPELRLARYTNVPPGDYTLEVKAANRSGEWTTAHWPLHVLPAWYETTAFRGGFVVLALLTLGGLVRLRTRVLVRRAAVLHELVAQRTQELEQRSRELEASQEQLRELATRDGLTGAWNRRALMEILEREVHRAKRERLPLTLVMADIDHFKRINDEFGHQAGDQVLREFVARLSRGVRGYDVVGRYGGEEFTLLMLGLDIAAAGDRERIEVIHAAVAAEPMSVGPLTCSFGAVTLTPGGALGVEDLVAAADEALYRAKRNGRDRVEYAAT